MPDEDHSAPQDEGSAVESTSRLPLTPREREILGLLAEGMSGSRIAEQLVLSPETVRTHVRNAMARLGASTRSQAVALALKQSQIAGARSAPAGGMPSGLDRSADLALQSALASLVSLYDVDRGAAYLVEEDGLAFRRVAVAGGASEQELPGSFALGEGALGRVALERRAQLVPAAGGDPGGLIAAPMLASGRLTGVIALASRASRPVGRSELLLLHAFANRAAEVLLAGSDVEVRLDRAIDRFRTAWAASIRSA